MATPNHRPTATLTVSSSSLRPRAAIGSACNHYYYYYYYYNLYLMQTIESHNNYYFHYYYYYHNYYYNYYYYCYYYYFSVFVDRHYPMKHKSTAQCPYTERRVSPSITIA